MFCSSCGGGIPEDGRFCGTCGARVASVARSAERSAPDVRRRPRWRMVVGIAVVALMAVAVGFAVLGDQSDTPGSVGTSPTDTVQRVGVSTLAGEPVDASVSVVDVDELQGDRVAEVVGAIYDVSVSDGGSGPFRLTLPAATDDPSSELISTWDAQLSIWLPVETTVDGVDLVADVEHLSLWGSVASWVQYRVGLLTGNRARAPECGQPPEWAPEIVTVEDLNAELLACIEADSQDRLVVKIVNNRDYQVFVDFNASWVGTPSTTVPTEIWTAFLQYTESQFGNGSLYLTGGTEAQVTFEQPTQAGTMLTGYARRDISSVLAYAVFELVGIVGADIPVGGGKTLGIEAIQCYVDVVDSSRGFVEGAVSGSSDQLVEAIGGLVSCIDGVVEQGLGQALPGTAMSSKLAAAKRYLLAFQVAKYANTVADLLVNDRPGTEADLVDLSVFWKPGSAPGFVGVEPVTYSTPLSMTGMAGLHVGMTLSQAEAATGQVLDFDFLGGYCFYAGIQSLDGVSMLMDGEGPDSSASDGIVSRISLWSPEFSTSVGIRVGDSEADLLKRLGTELAASPHAYVENGIYYDLYRPSALPEPVAMRFTVEEGAVASIHAGFEDFTSLVEGCF